VFGDIGPNSKSTKSSRGPAVPNLKSMKPIRKVTTGSLVGAITTLAFWALAAFWQIKLPSEVGNSITILVSFAASYFTPCAADELTLIDDSHVAEAPVAA
jgi:hypothetical protein